MNRGGGGGHKHSVHNNSLKSQTRNSSDVSLHLAMLFKETLGTVHVLGCSCVLDTMFAGYGAGALAFSENRLRTCWRGGISGPT